MATFFAYPWAAWLMLALLGALVEVALPLFACIFVAFGALVAAATAVRFGAVAQFAAFGVTTLGSLIFVRPWLGRRRSVIPSRTEVLIGLTGPVTVALGPEGRVRVGGEDWAARASSPVDVGRTIQVTGADGIVLLVKEI